ncbi:MAG TPA: hypothetical protein VIJ44_06105 [Acidimicrobiia bacterium]
MVVSRLLLMSAFGLGLSVPGASSVPQPHTVSDLAATISAKGLGCQDLQVAPPPSETIEATCTVWHEANVELDVLSSHAVLTKQVPKAVATVCAQLRKAHSSVKIVFVIGSNWVATFESTVNARPLAKAMNAKIQPLKCS